MLEDRPMEYMNQQREHHRHAAILQQPHEDEGEEQEADEREMQDYEYDNREMEQEDIDEQEEEGQRMQEAMDRQIGKTIIGFNARCAFNL
jgi:hypothetical protein